MNLGFEYEFDKKYFILYSKKKKLKNEIKYGIYVSI